MAERISNRIKYPEAFAFFEEQARNIMGTDISNLGNYRIPKPDKSGKFIYADSIEMLWSSFIKEWYKPSIDSPSVYGKIQYSVQNF